MWTKKDCARQQKLAKTVKRYPSDLTDKEWALIRPLLPPASGEGRRRKTDLREIINALSHTFWMFVEDAPARIRAVANCLLVVSTTDEAFPLCNDIR